MNDKELADKVVALGVATTSGDLYSRDNPYSDFSGISAKRFVRSWAVAGALIERCDHIDGMKMDTGHFHVLVWNSLNQGKGQHDSIPRAIIEACVGALDSVGDRLNHGD